MRESAEFLASLKHDNPGRPVFRIVPAAFDTQLEITFRGQSMLVPISEVLHFAVSWQVDQDMQWDAKAPHTTLRIHPYPIYGARVLDPDGTSWGTTAWSHLDRSLRSALPSDDTQRPALQCCRPPGSRQQAESPANQHEPDSSREA